MHLIRSLSVAGIVGVAGLTACTQPPRTIPPICTSAEVGPLPCELLNRITFHQGCVHYGEPNYATKPYRCVVAQTHITNYVGVEPLYRVGLTDATVLWPLPDKAV